jgi:Flp pilus assembly protein TadD
MHRVYTLIDDGEEKMATGDPEGGLSEIREAVSLGPTIDDAHIDLGIIYLKLGKKDEALKAFRQALRLNPRMKTLIKQLPEAGLMEKDPDILKELGIE